MGNDNWEKFERLVAAINATKMRGADVRWNEKIDGRQFDVVIRFKFGDYAYLTVIECKDFKTNVPIEKVEAFVTKSIGAKANKAIMFASSGFQSGCINIAKQHGIELITLKQTNEIHEESLDLLITPAINIFGIRWKKYGTRQDTPFPDGPELPYLVKSTLIFIPKEDSISLNNLLIKWQIENQQKITTNETEFSINLPEAATVRLPNSSHQIRFKNLTFKARIVSATTSSTATLDPYVIERQSRKLILHEMISDSTSELMYTDVDHGFDTTLKEKTFYHSPNLGFNYFIESINNGLIHWLLLESYQHGKKIDVRFTATIENSKGYIEITNQIKIDKLQKYLKNFYKLNK